MLMSYTRQTTTRLGAWELGMHHDHKKKAEMAYNLVTRPVGTVVKRTLETNGVLPSFEEKVEEVVMGILRKHGLL